ncbi:sugar transporter [Phaeobacter sp. PT47_59]|uniref:sugar transporter n=1 Tax=Phaeobacter sp. PT47_59 TaxID=3029979 RepID=UPI0023800B2D|nr:sugar transporter [Phaeobacter sp. PT47_59]MDE4175237.1 sugar transporter [Phaeobacter sp. PT47_59]
MGLKSSGKKTGGAGRKSAAQGGADTDSNVKKLPQQPSHVQAAADQDDEPAAAQQKNGGGGGRKKLKKLRQKVKVTEAALEDAKRQAAEAPAYPVARPAQMRRRHWGLVVSFLLLVLAPLAAVVFYLFTIAEDQYISTAGFTVRSQESSGATDILGGLANFAGSTTASDGDILYEFIQSQEMVEAVDRAVPLRPHYSQSWPRDWVFSLWPDATLEEMIWYWHRIVGISYDSGSGLTEVQVVAFDADTAQTITRAIVEESQTRINALNEQAREDAMRYAREDLDEALERLKGAREALTQFRTRTRIVDPEADIQGRMGVMNNLQQQLAEALIEYDLLRGTVGDSDPRLKKAQQHIDVIRERIDIERQTFTSSNTDTGAVGEDYPSLIAEFERLTVDLQYAEETYRAALTALEAARDEATRQSRYLATYIKPTRAQESEYPGRYMLSGLAGLFLLLTWSILALIYYSIRDRS